MFVQQLCTEVQIWRTQDGLGTRIYYVQKRGLHESQGLPVFHTNSILSMATLITNWNNGTNNTSQ